MILAYVDPGLGALIWQSIVAAFVGLMFYLKKTRDWIVWPFVKLFRPAPKSSNTADGIPPVEKAGAEPDAQ